ncbi:MAG: hypothetical protein WDN09_00950 [bacterium]
MKAIKSISGILVFLIGILVVLHGSSLNPLWHIPGYAEWFNSHIPFAPRPINVFAWIAICIFLGGGIAALGLKLIPPTKKN